MQSVSILGCGWLGKPLAVALLKGGYPVSGSTTQESKVPELHALGIRPFLIKFDPQLSGYDAHDFFQVDTLIVNIPPRRKSGLTDVFLEQLKQIIHETLKGHVSHVLFISSTSVYPDGDAVVTEDDADPESYLVKAENLFFAESKFKTTVLRFGGLIGKDRHPGRFLANKKDVSGGNHAVNVIHQQDCIAIIKTIMDQEVWNEVFNACADHHPTRREFYVRASEAAQLEAPQFLESDVSRNKIVNSDKLKSKLNYRFVYPDLFAMLKAL